MSPSLLTSLVTIRHERTLGIVSLLDALEDAGFEVASITQDGVLQDDLLRSSIHDLEEGLDKSKETKSTRSKNASIQQRHVLDCEQCREEMLLQEQVDGIGPADLSLKGKARLHISEVGVEKPASFAPSPLSGTTIGELEPKELWRASVAIGGMTCASCVRSITEEVERLPWVEKVSVNLIGHSANIDFIDKDNADKLVEAIEDVGFDAVLDSVVNLSEQQASMASQRRSIEVRVDGMFCVHCPQRILDSLDVYDGDVEVDKPLSLKEPILRFSYVPNVRGVTIRSILSTLRDVDDRLQVSIYQPPSLEERSQRIHAVERRRIVARVVLSVMTAIPTFIIGIVFMSLVPEHNSTRQYLMQPLAAGVSRTQWALFIMATPVYIFAADIFHRRAISEIYSMWKVTSKIPLLQRLIRFGSMNMLMSLGTSAAYISSVAQLIAAGVHPPSTNIDSSFYFDSVVFLTMFLLIGRLIEAYSKSRTGDAITMLGKLRPYEALLVEQDADGDSLTDTVDVALLEIGDTVRILHGDSPPCDGTVLVGDSLFDESSLTGESRLVHKVEGDQVFAGTMNKAAPISIRVTGTAGSSMLDQIVAAVREGQTRRAPIERLADRLTAYFVPSITVVAILTWVVWLALGVSGTLSDDYKDGDTNWAVWSLQFAIAVFVVACPCGLALAAPTAIFVGGGLAAQHGILARGGGEAFEKASQLDCIVFDKTGTLTMGGNPTVTEYEFLRQDLAGIDKIIGIVRRMEENSSHPIANALVAFCAERSNSSLAVESIEELAGKGLSGRYVAKNDDDTDLEVIIGNETLMAEHNMFVSARTIETLHIWKSSGKSVAIVALRPTGSDAYKAALMVAISDPIRPEAASIIRELRSSGKEIYMLSGDNHITATAVGIQVGIPETHIISNVLPSGKAAKIQDLQRTLHPRDSSGREILSRRAMIAMVGDGINDSPALTAADVGIAIGSGSDIAITSAEFVLVSSNLSELVTLIDLSKAVFARVKWNFAWALVYNLAAIPLAAGCFYAITTSSGDHVRLDPVWASLAMACSSISVVCGSLALRCRIPWIGFRVRKMKLPEVEHEDVESSVVVVQRPDEEQGRFDVSF